MEGSLIKITENTKIRQIGSIDATDLDGEKVMMDLEKGCYFMFNQVATRVWNLAEEAKTVGTIINSLLEEYDIDDETCKQQVIYFVQELLDLHLVIVEDK